MRMQADPRHVFQKVPRARLYMSAPLSFPSSPRPRSGPTRRAAVADASPSAPRLQSASCRSSRSEVSVSSTASTAWPSCVACHSLARFRRRDSRPLTSLLAPSPSQPPHVLVASPLPSDADPHTTAPRLSARLGSCRARRTKESNARPSGSETAVDRDANTTTCVSLFRTYSASPARTPVVWPRKRLGGCGMNIDRAIQ